MIYFTAHTFKCVCHCRRAMFRVLGMYNFGGLQEIDCAHIAILSDWTLINGVTLILPSRIAKNSSAHNAKRNFWNSCEGFLRVALTIPALSEKLPKRHFLTAAWCNLKIFLGHMTSFEVIWKSLNSQFFPINLHWPQLPQNWFQTVKSRCLS